MRACCFIIVHRVWKRLKKTHQHKNVTRDHITRGAVPHSVCPEVVRVKSAKRLSRWLWNVRKNSASFLPTIRKHWKVLFGGLSRLQWIPPLCSEKFNRKTHEASEKAASRSNGVGMAVRKVKYGFGIVCSRWRVGLDRIWSLVMSPKGLGDFSERKSHQSYFLRLWRWSFAGKFQSQGTENSRKYFTSLNSLSLCFHLLHHTPNLHVCTDLIKIFPVVQFIHGSPRKTPNEIAGF